MINKEATKLVSVKDFLESGEVYRIPNYQRAYTWEKYSINTFISDVIKNAIDDTYYLGTIYTVSVSNQDAVNYVIDGQQRLITIFLMLNSFRLLYGYDISNYIKIDDNKNVLDIYDGTPQFYELFKINNVEEIKSLHARIEKQSITTSQILYNQLDILKSLQQNEFDSKYILNILENLLIIKIDVTKDTLGYKIFENLNSKGIVLSNVDVIKNSLFSKIDEDSSISPFENFKYKKWKEIEEHMICFDKINLRNLRKIKSEYTTNLEDMFKFYVQCVLKKKNITKTDYGTAKQYINYLESKLIDDKKFAEKELTILSKFSTYSRYVFYPQNIHYYAIGQRINKYLKAIETLKIKQHRSLSICIIKQITLNNCQSCGDEVITFYKKMILFHYLFNTMTSSIPSVISSVYFDASIRMYEDTLKNNHIINILKDVIHSYDANLPTRVEVEEKIENVLFYMKEEIEEKVKLDRKAYKVYTEKFFGNNLFMLIEDCNSINLGNINIETIEHILNRKNIYTDYSNYKLFSMLPLERELNKEADDKILSEKINIYRKSNYYLVKEFVKFYDKEASISKSDKDIVIKWKYKFVEILFSLYHELTI